MPFELLEGERKMGLTRIQIMMLQELNRGMKTDKDLFESVIPDLSWYKAWVTWYKKQEEIEDLEKIEERIIEYISDLIKKGHISSTTLYKIEEPGKEILEKIGATELKEENLLYNYD